MSNKEQGILNDEVVGWKLLLLIFVEKYALMIWICRVRVRRANQKIKLEVIFWIIEAICGV